MENRITLGIGFAILGMGVQMIAFFLELDSFYTIQLCVLFLLLAIYLGMRGFRRQHPESSFGQLFRSGMQGGAIFSLLFSIFTYIYHRWIDQAYFIHKIESRVAEAAALNYSPEDIEKVRSTAEFLFSSGVQSTVILLVFMFMSVLYALTVSILIRRIPALWR